MVELKQYTKRMTKNAGKKIKLNWKRKLILKHLPENGTFLDIGCASGALASLLPKKKNYYGLDYNPGIVKFCKSNKLNVQLCDITKDKIPFKDNLFDVVFFSHVIEHLDSRSQQKALCEISRVLKKGGILILFAPTPYNWYFYDDHTHVRPCTHHQLEQLAKDSGFTEAIAKYSKVRWAPSRLQTYLRLPPMRFFLWEVFMIAKK